MTARLGELLLGAAPDAPQPPDRVAAVAARVRRQRRVNSVLAVTAAAAAVLALAGAAGILLAEPRARHTTPIGPAASEAPASTMPSGSVPSGSAASTPGQQFESTVDVVDTPDGADRPTEVTLDKTAVRLAYVRITAPQGDTGRLVIVSRDGRVVRDVQLADIRDHETHISPPLAVDGPIVVRLACVAAGRTGTGGPADACRATVHVTGTLRT